MTSRSRFEDSEEGISIGLPSVIRFLDSTHLINQQVSDRPSGVITVRVEAWHADILQFLQTTRGRNNTLMAKNLRFAISIPDIL